MSATESWVKEFNNF